MTASAATKSEKLSVFGVNLEVLRIPSRAPNQGAPIVFLHEGLGSVAMWRDFPQQLCDAAGRSGLVYSRRGYGQSDGASDVRGTGRLKPDYMHVEAWHVLPELLRICQMQRPILLGHSDGATIALLHAAKHPVQACIVMAPHLFVESLSISAIKQAKEAFEGGDLRQRLVKFHADVDGAFWQWNDIWLNPEFRGFNIEDVCQQITCPLLAIQGHDDPYGTMAQIDALGDTHAETSSHITMNSRINNRRLLKLETCGHSPHRDQMQAVLIGIADFVKQVSFDSPSKLAADESTN